MAHHHADMEVGRPSSARIAVPMPATTLVLLFSPSCASHGASFVASLLLHNLELMHVQSSHRPIHTESTTTSRTTHPRKPSIISLQIIHLHLHLQHTLPCHAVLCACICHSRESPHPPPRWGSKPTTPSRRAKLEAPSTVGPSECVRVPCAATRWPASGFI